MSSVTSALGAVRQRWVRTLIDTYAFGMYTVMVVMTLYHLLKRGNAWSAHRVVLVYTVVMFCITVGWYYTQTRLDEAETIELLAGPTLSDEIALGDSGSMYDIASTVLSTLQFWGNDALMLYRAKMIFAQNRLIMVFPLVTFAAYIGISVVVLASYDPQVQLSNAFAVGLTFYALSAFLNVLITTMIATKLLLHRQSMIRSGMYRREADIYVSAVGVLAESAAPYSLSLIVFSILRGVDNSSYRWFEGVMMAMSFLCQAWIILRISMGTTSIRTDSASTTYANNASGTTKRPRFVHSTFIASDASSSFAHKGRLEDDIPLSTRV